MKYLSKLMIQTPKGSSQLFTFCMLAILFGSFAFYSSSLSEIKTQEYIRILEGNKSYTLDLAEAMPAENYTFRPHDSVRSFGEQMAHIGLSTSFLLDLFVNDQPAPSDPAVFAEAAKMEKSIGQSKEECMKKLQEAFDKLIMTYKDADEALLNSKFTVVFDPAQPSFSKSTGIEFVNNHIIHHRSQALVSLRMQGIVAPQFRLYGME